MNTNPAKKRLALLAKLLLVAGLLYFLASKGLISASATGRAFSQWRAMSIGISMMVITSLLGVIRWQWLLRAQGIHLPLMRTLQLTFIGNFFNIALPGAVSGDFVKAFYVAKEVEGQRSRAFGSILFDRVAGLSALVLVSTGAMLIGFESLWGTTLFRATQLLLSIAATCVLAFYGYLFLVREQHDPLLKVFDWIERKWPKTAALKRIYESLRHYHNHRVTVLKVLAISVLVHMLVGYALLNFAHALGETNIPVDALYVVFPLGLLVTAIPVLPAGVGTGHAAFAALFKLFHSERGADVFSLYALFTIAIGGVGGLFYLRFKGREAAPIPAADPVKQPIT